MAELKDRQLKEFLSSPIKVGESVDFRTTIQREKRVKKKGTYVIEYEPESVERTGKVVAINNDGTYDVSYKERTMYGQQTAKLSDADIISRHTDHIGANPFVEKAWYAESKTYQYSIRGIVSTCCLHISEPYGGDEPWYIGGVDVNNLNKDPWVIDKDGNKQYYQRGYVWDIDDKKDLIRSIFNKLDCGTIVIRQRSSEWLKEQISLGNLDVALVDVVDGKQRLTAIEEYMNDIFDVDGIYYSDLNGLARSDFKQSQVFSVVEFGVNASDADIIKAFLHVNYSGKICSKEHIEYVKEINQKM